MTLLRPAHDPGRQARDRREGDRGDLLLLSQRASSMCRPKIRDGLLDNAVVRG